MAVVTPSTISTGMENGPETIDQNFKLITSQTNAALQDTGWKQLTVTHATGTIWIRRIGTHVFLHGDLPISETASASAPLVICTMPSGYTPDKQQFPQAFQKVGEFISHYQINQGNTQINAIHVLNTSAKDMAFDWDWETVDDFPA